MRSTVAGHTPASLASGQIAINEADGNLFWCDASGAVRSLNLIALVSTTPAAGDASTRVATTAFVKAAIDTLVAAAPGTLDTLKELADAIGDDANFAGSVTAALANRLRVDAAQSLSAAQKAQAQANLGLNTLAIGFANIDPAAVASQTDAAAGTADNKLMTPLKVGQAVAGGAFTFKSSAPGGNSRVTGFKTADGADIGTLSRSNRYTDDHANNCAGYLPTGNCLGNAQWTPPNGNWWTWGLGLSPANPNRFDFAGGATVAYQAVSVGFVYSGYTLTADAIGGGEYHRSYANCNCGALNCYSNCNCNCDCNCAYACDCNCFSGS
ncbi:Bacteriophage tail fiber protein (fragment) [Bradyrhizobium sp. ORS 278]